jgi:hypothetical protein
LFNNRPGSGGHDNTHSWWMFALFAAMMASGALGVFLVIVAL